MRINTGSPTHHLNHWFMAATQKITCELNENAAKLDLYRICSTSQQFQPPANNSSQDRFSCHHLIQGGFVFTSFSLAVCPFAGLSKMISATFTKPWGLWTITVVRRTHDIHATQKYQTAATFNLWCMTLVATVGLGRGMCPTEDLLAVIWSPAWYQLKYPYLTCQANQMTWVDTLWLSAR